MKLKYHHIIGTGGIGSGMFFSLKGDHTLGRNESRMATLEPAKDFCKLHIILHYISVFLKARGFGVYPIGKVGNDAAGHEQITRMKAAGMNTGAVTIANDHSTLFSVCFQYPDRSGGNITTENSASNQVTPADISRFFDAFPVNAGIPEIILAVPEVPVEARLRLLEEGRNRGSLNAASLLSGEVPVFLDNKAFGLIDILSINIDEAAAIAASGSKDVDIVNKCIYVLKHQNNDIRVLITDGSNGCYAYANGLLEHTPAIQANVRSTAGAGDAFFSGTLIGLCLGLSLFKGNNDRQFAATPMKTAVEFGTMLAALSVTSTDTINLQADPQMLYEFMESNNLQLSDEFTQAINQLR